MARRHVKVRCATCGGMLDQGTADMWTCEKCGDECEPPYADWKFTEPQQEALRILTVYGTVWSSSKNDEIGASVSSGSLRVLIESNLAKSAPYGRYTITDLGRKVYEAI